MLRSEMQTHLQPFKDRDKVKAHVMNVELSKLEICLKHGFKVDTPFEELYGFSKSG